jgi:hypothetical protein
MDKLTEEELAEFKDIYNLVDRYNLQNKLRWLYFYFLIVVHLFELGYNLIVRAGRGFINKAQLGELMDTLGIDATADEVDLMLSEIDLGKKSELLIQTGL